MSEVKNIRDLLVAVVGRELREARAKGTVLERYPDLDAAEAAVAWTLDAMTLHSVRLLLEFRTAQGWPEGADR